MKKLTLKDLKIQSYLLLFYAFFLILSFGLLIFDFNLLSVSINIMAFFMFLLYVSYLHECRIELEIQDMQETLVDIREVLEDLK